MLDALNRYWFLQINATPDSAPWLLTAAQIIARDVILIIPALLVVLWLWGPGTRLDNRRQLALKISLALVFSLGISLTIGLLLPHPRPFAVGLGYHFLAHAPDSSFPSDHATAAFTLAIALLCWHRLWSGIVLLVIATAIGGSRVYLGIHWPLDILGAVLAALMGCLLSALVCSCWGGPLYRQLLALYRRSFAFPIRKGWVRG
ncbi:undecaprenyl-diphosphate phosphatase [Shimwellia blattae]|uniref:undecaprenyl-diphosphate phosphatase n=1 Tax=Shimwellia blattae (strain ATCC 29907 / DSM 4481 / JCM 1650 / NBRC 105725 / CDC 9005-74) TaxID=630626 RepID=I2BAV1_SHIBC|nr:undecaprenyl-diphosphate phosphatase [Shimwellia blattae]AFJ47655.1 putative undecaprenyl-diphosphatase with PAP2 domain [Shimwellia blattae DSM 4481 = NBRC 105725]GAB79765.1 putative undecaprenyl-diphosphatase YbjG [Shimwellia blattae DSM 4481 = NBRC 105725]VDY65154.1 Putative undecaprenyl-diphosphatase ybjG [Shimwellia blattae]VEC23742.1 Putative undecaprenyl-diphosphatase ybjG [Shimwellia blattae]